MNPEQDNGTVVRGGAFYRQPRLTVPVRDGEETTPSAALQLAPQTTTSTVVYLSPSDNVVKPELQERLQALKQTIQTYLGIVCIVAGIIFALISWKNNAPLLPPLPGLPEKDSSQQSPGSAQSNAAAAQIPPPSKESVYAYSRPAHLPKRIEIPKLGVVAKVVDVGTNKKGEVDSPISLYDAGWFTSSANPTASPGTAVIVGHSGGASFQGVFETISQLSSGDTIKVVMGNNKEVTYKVHDKKQVDAASLNMGAYLSYDSRYASQLNLITCGGPVLSNHREYRDRIIVMAHRN